MFVTERRVSVMSSFAFSSSNATPASSTERSHAFAKLGLATVVAAVLANVLVYFIGDALIGYDPDFIVLGNVSGAVIFTVVPAIVAVLLYGALLRYVANPARIFTIVSAVILALSVIPDLTYIPTVEGASNAQTAVLIFMHTVAAGVIVGMLTSFARPRTR
jgi:hypothetical protein